MRENPFYAQNLSAQAELYKTIISGDDDLARKMDKMFPPGLEQYVEQQLQQMQQMAEMEEYRKKRKAEGASPEQIEAEVQQRMQGQEPDIRGIEKGLAFEDGRKGEEDAQIGRSGRLSVGGDFKPSELR